MGVKHSLKKMKPQLCFSLKTFSSFLNHPCPNILCMLKVSNNFWLYIFFKFNKKKRGRVNLEYFISALDVSDETGTFIILHKGMT